MRIAVELSTNKRTLGMREIVAIIRRNKAKFFLSVFGIVVVATSILIWSVNQCNFKSFASIKRSVDLFGLSSYDYCVSHAIPDSVHPGRLLDYFARNFHRADSSALPTIEKVHERPGQETYLKRCVSCHGKGLSNAPVRGDDTVWNAKLRDGIGPLLKRTKTGFGGMPP
ncbi:MAG: c-type cytochrome, partial [Pseudomonadales bacterium]